MTESIEIWRDIEEYKGLYQVSNLGRVKSLPRNTTSGKILRLKNHRTGYLYVNLCKDGKEKQYRVHRLVAQAFLPNPDNLPYINHKSEKKFENYVWVNKDGTIDPEKSNLEWCTQKYNINYGTVKVRKRKRMGQKIKQMALDGKLITIWSSAKEAKKEGYNDRAIYQVCQEKRKTHRGYLWAFC